jgi:hypothetical protein
MEKDISELAYKDTASMTKKVTMNGTGTRFFFFIFTIDELLRKAGLIATGFLENSIKRP